MQFSENFDGFRTKWFTGLLELIKLYKQNPLEEIFTIYQTTLASIKWILGVNFRAADLDMDYFCCCFVMHFNLELFKEIWRTREKISVKRCRYCVRNILSHFSSYTNSSGIFNTKSIVRPIWICIQAMMKYLYGNNGGNFSNLDLTPP